MEVANIPTKSALVFRSLMYVLLGLVLLAWPGATILVIVFLVAINVFINGIFMVFEPLADKDSKHSVLTFLLGIAGVLFGVFLLSRPEVTAQLTVLLVALWAVLFGISDIYIGLLGKNEKVKGSWLFVLAGLISFIFGVYLLFNPLIGTLTLIWVLGTYAVAVGVLLLGFTVFAYPTPKGKKK